MKKERRAIERINHPPHYGGDTLYEAIKVIEAWGLGFCLGNTVKYISRVGKKPGGLALDDLKKARWYLDREITNVMRQSGGRVSELTAQMQSDAPRGTITSITSRAALAVSRATRRNQ